MVLSSGKIMLKSTTTFNDKRILKLKNSVHNYKKSEKFKKSLVQKESGFYTGVVFQLYTKSEKQTNTFETAFRNIRI